MTLSDNNISAGTKIGELEGEIWATVPVVAQPMPLRRIVLLDRRPGTPTRMSQMVRPLAPLLGNLLRYPVTPERELDRFSVASNLALRVEIMSLMADVHTPVQQLAALALEGLAPR
jgi:hypothetical protein